MIDIPKKVYSIKNNDTIRIDDNHIRTIDYVINENKKNEKELIVQLPYMKRPVEPKEIIEERKKFINGFKLVKFDNGEYGYIEKERNIVMPYRYDIATDFNEYGFAMVAKDGNVTWINTNFEYLATNGLIVEEKIQDKNYIMRGFEEVHSFSEDNIPLSKLFDSRKSGKSTSYFNTNGEIQKFYMNGSKYVYCDSFYTGTNFKYDYALADDKILYSNGTFIDKYLLKEIENETEYKIKANRKVRTKK